MDPVTIGIALATKFVPDIVSALGGNIAGEVASKVIDIAKDVTGYKDPEDAQRALEANPEMVLEFRKAVMANELEFIRLQLADVQNARARDVELAKAGRRNTRADLMLAATFVGLLASVATMVVCDMDANSAAGGVIIMLAGKFISMWGTAFDFEFGSSRSSQTKDSTISNLSK